MKTYLVTGGISGVGKAIATGIAQTGQNLIIVSRNTENGEKTVQEISAKTANKNISFLTADLSLMKSVKDLGNKFKQQHNQLHGLVNAAGAWYFKKEMTSEGLDKSFAINYLCHFALANSLLDLLTATQDARVATVAGAPRFLKNPKMDLNNLQLDKNFSWLKSVKLGVLQRVYFGFALADKLQHTKASSLLFHPGFVKSNLGKTTAPWWAKLMMSFSSDIRNAPETCESGVFAATQKNAKLLNGKFLDEKGQIVNLEKIFDTSIGEKLWLMSEQLLAK